MYTMLAVAVGYTEIAVGGHNRFREPIEGVVQCTRSALRTDNGTDFTFLVKTMNGVSFYVGNPYAVIQISKHTMGIQQDFRSYHNPNR